MKWITLSGSILALQLGAFTVLNAQAPIIDDSDNFSLVEEQDYNLPEQSVAKAQINEEEEDLTPLAQDNAPDINDAGSLAEQLQTLQQEIQELRGQLEVQAHDLKLMQQQQLAFYKDLDNRLQTLKGSPSSNEAQRASLPASLNLGTASKSAERGNPADEQIRYLAAYDLVKNKRFDEATLAMKNFIAQYPQGGYTANAHYWLGELYLVKKENDSAIQEFETVLTRFPSSSKAASSQLKIAYALIASGKQGQARERLQEILRKYPDTPTAHMANNKLEALKHL